MIGIDSPKAIVIGCAVGVLTLATQSIGLTLQRKSHIQEDEKSPDIPRRPAFKCRMWQLGLLLFLLSNVIGSSVQITTLPLVILSPLQAVGLVFNSICSSILLDEPFTQYAVMGTVLVSIGALDVAFFGVVPEPHHDLKELLVLLHRTPFVIWMMCTLILILSILVLIHVSKSWKPSIAHPDRLPLLRGMMYGVICGILSAHSLLMAKSAVEIVVRGFMSDHWKDLQQYQSWVIVLFFLIFAVSQLYFLNCALHLCSTSVIYPLNFCIYNIVTILNGLIYFEQSSKLSTANCWLVAFGTLLILVGVVFLSWRLGLNDDSALHHHHHHSDPSHHNYTEIESNSFTHYDSPSPLSENTSTLTSARVLNYGSLDSTSKVSTYTHTPMQQKSSNYHSFSTKPINIEDSADQQTITSSSLDVPPDPKEPVSPFTAASKRQKHIKSQKQSKFYDSDEDSSVETF